MKLEFLEYLKFIGITEILKKKILDIYEFYEHVCPEKIEDIFVTEYIKDDVSREYESVWFFSEKYCMEAKSFTTVDNFDMCSLSKAVIYLCIEKKNYDFKKATAESRLTLGFQTSDLMGDIKATRENCDYLKDIFLKYFVPNLITNI